MVTATKLCLFITNIIKKYSNCYYISKYIILVNNIFSTNEIRVELDMSIVNVITLSFGNVQFIIYLQTNQLDTANFKNEIRLRM